LQFLVEACVLATLGGLAGTISGVLATAGLRELLGWPMTVDPVALSLALSSSAITGIVFGFFPARRAAELDPIVALRHE
jgi:putative ABC transport system permease protein